MLPLSGQPVIDSYTLHVACNDGMMEAIGGTMIALRRINGQEFVLNADFIESLESTPDTLITLTSGKKLMVRNTLEDVVRKSIKYKQLIHQSLQVISKTKSDVLSGEPGG